MITYGSTKGAKEMKVPGLGWTLTQGTDFGGFRIIALADHGKGFKTREEARKAKAELAQ